MDFNQPMSAGALPPDPSTAGQIVGDGKRRVMIEAVTPEIDAGRFPVKRVPGERVLVEADIFADGHDQLSAVLKYRFSAETGWCETPMEPIGNDRWRGEFSVSELGIYQYTVEGWIDHYKSWRTDLVKRVHADQDVTVDLLIGAELVEAAAQRAPEVEAEQLRHWAKEFSAGDRDTLEDRAHLALDEEMAALTMKYPQRAHSTEYARELQVAVDPVLAQTGAWYELFPRSCPGKTGPHGTFRDVEAHLPHVAGMGFDVLYLPPIHPIGRAFRKGKNNKPVCEPDEPGSPWGIGAEEGGHKSIHPELGTLEDFHRMVDTARNLGVEIALDIAWQCSPDHPWVREHPSWFRHRPDGTIQYAENPPKKYQDIYPINFETDDWQGLWQELRSVIQYWVDQGVRVFRVDNPHTKAFPFWEWAIGGIRLARPDVIFLAEAFTRPRVMEGLSKLGFNQSYNYFPWRNNKEELTEYLTELSEAPLIEYFRPNLWPNTPDILTDFLQEGGRPAFVIRLILAATLGASYGIYGPAFELMESKPREPGSEEYLDSEKYEIRDWDLSSPDNLSSLVTAINGIRRAHPALHYLHNLHFHPTDSDALLAYSKATDDGGDIMLVVVNLDPHRVQSGWIELDLDALAIEPGTEYEVHDLLTDAKYLWHGSHNYVELNPFAGASAHVFHVNPLTP